jgi:hypothetical protein
VTTSRLKWRCGIEFALFVSTLVVCASALFVTTTSSAPVRLLDRTGAIVSVDVLDTSATRQWTRDVVVSSPDSSDDEDDDGDDGDLTVEAPVPHDAVLFHTSAPHFCADLDRSSCITPNNHSLRAPPLSATAIG